MENSDISISFTGKHNRFAFLVINHLDVVKALFWGLGIVALLVIVPIIGGHYTYFLGFCFPIFFYLVSLSVFIFYRNDDKVFSLLTKVDYDLKIIDNRLFVNDEEISLTRDIKLYRYRRFLFLITFDSFFVIDNNNYKIGNRELFLEWIKNNKIKCVRGL